MSVFFDFFLKIWSGTKPSVKITIAICLTLIIIASMVYGYFPELIGIAPSD